MIETGAHVLVDTNVIIEAQRTGCWKVLCNHFRMDTVAKCLEECATGNPSAPGYVPVDIAALSRDLKPKEIAIKELSALTLRYPEAQYLDAGERYLLAHAIALKEAYLLCSPDKMCVRAGFGLGLLDHFVALEELASASGARVELRGNFTTRFMEKVRTDIRLGLL